MFALTCLTPTAEIRQLLRTDRRQMGVTFKFYDRVYDRDVHESMHSRSIRTRDAAFGSALTGCAKFMDNTHYP